MLTTGHRPDAARLVAEATTLSQAGWSVAIVGPGNDQIPSCYTAWRPLSRRHGILGRVARLVGMLFKVPRMRPDVLHVHELDSLAVACLLGKLLRIPVVYDCHEYHAEAIAQRGSRRPWVRRMVESIIHGLEAGLARCAHHVISVNEDLAGRFRDLGCDAIALPNYPLPTEFEWLPEPGELEPRYVGDVALIYIGKVSEDRGGAALIRVLERVLRTHPHARLLLIGRPTPEGYLVELERMASTMGIVGRIDFIGPLPHGEVLPYLKSADLGIFLLQPVSERYNRGEPIKLFEYAASGLPVVISDLPAKRRLVEEMQNGILVDPTDVESTAAAIADLLDDPERRRIMGANGRRAFLEKYNWERVEDRLTELYARIMEGR